MGREGGPTQYTKPPQAETLTAQAVNTKHTTERVSSGWKKDQSVHMRISSRLD